MGDNPVYYDKQEGRYKEIHVYGSGRVPPEKKEEDKPDCFIASAVYGDPHAREVETLRDYRDNVLMQNAFGRGIVRVYYCVAGEKTAEFIKDRAGFLIPAIRKGLDYIVRNYESKKD